MESVLSQTYENWEYVIVDNCSSDRTIEIARGYAARDDRVRVVMNDEFLEIIQNWNRALRQISPESVYCKVLHADDMMVPDCLERMVALALAHPSVAIVSAYRLNGMDVDMDGVIPWGTEVVPGREICRLALLGRGYVFGSPSSLLIRSDLIRARNRFYDPDYNFAEEYSFTEDVAACCEILRESDFGFVHQVLTFTRRDDRSPFSKFSRLGANLPEQINLVFKYGPVYLTKEEYERIVAVYLAFYAAFLLRSLPRFAKPEHRAYHVQAVRRILRSADARDLLEGASLQLRRMGKRRRIRARRA